MTQPFLSLTCMSAKNSGWTGRRGRRTTEKRKKMNVGTHWLLHVDTTEPRPRVCVPPNMSQEVSGNSTSATHKHTERSRLSVDSGSKFNFPFPCFFLSSSASLSHSHGQSGHTMMMMMASAEQEQEQRRQARRSVCTHRQDYACTARQWKGCGKCNNALPL